LGYYSPSLERKQVKGLLSEYKSKKIKVFKDIYSVLKEIEKTIAGIVTDAEAWCSGQQFCDISLDLKTWEDHYAQYESAFIKYLIYKVKKKKVLQDDPLEDFYYSLRRFLQIARLDEHIYKPFLDAISGGVISIQCCDPSIPLGYRIEGFHSVIAMSATLDPIEYYSDVLGFSKENTEQLILDSPFPPDHRKMIIIPSISTRYSQRQKEFPEYAEIIKRIVTIKPGNYLVFFPSFEFMQNVNLFLGSLNIERLIQRPNMSEIDREEFLSKLKKPGSNILLMGVLGGIFSEGVDYIGDMCIGVIIFSPGLPQITYARDLIKDYYDTNLGNGFEYAYVYPGINKVIQSAGRLIRSHQDKGIIVLVGERFAEEQINNLLPDYWFKTPDSLVITSEYKKEIKKFWSNIDKSE